MNRIINRRNIKVTNNLQPKTLPGLTGKIIITSIAILLSSNVIASDIFDSINKPTVQTSTSTTTTTTSLENSGARCSNTGRVIKCTGAGTITRDNSGGNLGDISITPLVISASGPPVVGTPPNLPPGYVPPSGGTPPVIGTGPVVTGVAGLGSPPAIGIPSLVASWSEKFRTPFLTGGQTAQRQYIYYPGKQVSPSYCGREVPAATAYWIRGLDFNTRMIENRAAPEWVSLYPNEIASYEFTVPQSMLGQSGGFSMNEATYARHEGFNVSVSKSPCDFKPVDGVWTFNNQTYNVCSDNSAQNFPGIQWLYTAKGDTKPKETYLASNKTVIDRLGMCKLEVGSTYYINIRIPPANNTSPVIDRCEFAKRSFARGEMGAENVGLASDLTCGGIIKFA